MKKRIIATLVIASLLAAGTLLYLHFNKPSDTSTPTPPKTCTTYGGQAEEQCIEDYIGLTQEAALAKAKQHDYLPKITSIDGVSQINNDLGGYIIYLVINDGLVTDAFFQ